MMANNLLIDRPITVGSKKSINDEWFNILRFHYGGVVDAGADFSAPCDPILVIFLCMLGTVHVQKPSKFYHNPIKYASTAAEKPENMPPSCCRGQFRSDVQLDSSTWIIQLLPRWGTLTKAEIHSRQGRQPLSVWMQSMHGD